MTLSYFGTFIAGFFFSYSFTAGPAAALLLLFGHEQSLLFAGLAGACGAMAGDLVIFKFTRFSFKKDSEEISKTKTFKFLDKVARFFYKESPTAFKKYVLVLFASLIIASPLPNEVGVAVMSTSVNITTKQFVAISLVLNAIGVYLLLFIGKQL